MRHDPNLSAPNAPPLRITVMQGQVRVGSGQPEILTTVLGSCIACCLYDPVAQVGGMNHFLLAEPSGGGRGVIADETYGLYLMELLVNEMMKRGAVKKRMKAHLYGGANMHAGMTRIGDANARFARQFLQDEGIPVVRCDTGGGSCAASGLRSGAGPDAVPHGRTGCGACADSGRAAAQKQR